MPARSGGALAGQGIEDLLLGLGSALLIGLGIVVGGYVVLRVYFETKRGLEGALAVKHPKGRCPNCEQTRVRLDGDLIPHCPECGWKPGWPVLRWVTRSLPARELRRSVTTQRLMALGLAVGLLWVGTVGAGAGLPGSAEPAPVNEIDTAAVETLDATDVEMLIVTAVNEERTETGLNEVDPNSRLATLARQRAAKMLTQDSIGQELRTNEQNLDQYGEVCAGPVGETAAGARYGTAFSTWKSDGEVSLTSESDLARYVLDQWRSTDGSQSTMLAEDWEQTGVGVAARDDGTVYVVQVYC